MTFVLWTDRKYTKDQNILLLEIWKHWILKCIWWLVPIFTWFFYLLNQRAVIFQKYESLLLLIHANLLSGIRYCVMLLYLRFMLTLTSCHSPPCCSAGTIYSLATYMATLQMYLCIDFLYQTVFYIPQQIKTMPWQEGY